MLKEKIQQLNFKNDNNKTIKIFFSHGIKLRYNNLVKIFVDLFNNYEICTEQNENADIIFYDQLAEKNTEYNDKSIFICISGEKQDISTYCDIGILTNLNFIHSYNIYFPQLFQSLWERRMNYKNIIINKKEKFCAYMYTYNLKYRIELYNFISQYKKVDALGRSCSNKRTQERKIYNENETYNDLAVLKYSYYKFVLALENEIVPGYFTEKIINPILANSIPIYAGPKEVFNYINKKRVIYIYDFENYEKMLDYVKKVDNDNELYNSILNEKIFVGDIDWNNFEIYIKNELRKILLEP